MLPLRLNTFIKWVSPLAPPPYLPPPSAIPGHTIIRPMTRTIPYPVSDIESRHLQPIARAVCARDAPVQPLRAHQRGDSRPFASARQYANEALFSREQYSRGTLPRRSILPPPLLPLFKLCSSPCQQSPPPSTPSRPHSKAGHQGGPGDPQNHTNTNTKRLAKYTINDLRKSYHNKQQF